MKSTKGILKDDNYRKSPVHSNKASNHKLDEVEKTLRDLEAKSLEMSRHLDNIRNDRSRLDDSIKHVNFDYENEKLKQEYSTMKSDNIIFREDINRLSEINRHLEEELSRQRNRK